MHLQFQPTCHYTYVLHSCSFDFGWLHSSLDLIQREVQQLVLGEVELVNSTGKTMLKQQIEEGINQINIGTLDKGLYILIQHVNYLTYQTKVMIY